jgi:hypothetical protein
MKTPLPDLRRIEGPGLEWNEKENVLACSSPHALVRAAGYFKHVYGPSGARILFRGQTKLWTPLLPGLYRAKEKMAQRFQSTQSAWINAYVEEARGAGAFIRSKISYDVAHEPLLQHYGIRTRWLDVVDNIWVALWFAVFDCVVDRKAPHFWHFDETTEENGYLLLMSPGRGERPVGDKPGLFETDGAQLIDLRVAAPSLYVRPHAQHGLLFRRKSYPAGDMALDAFTLGVIKVKRRHAKAWLGRGFLHTPRVVFPPPHYDAGYKRLIETAPPPARSLGGIGVVFP